MNNLVWLRNTLVKVSNLIRLRDTTVVNNDTFVNVFFIVITNIVYIVSHDTMYHVRVSSVIVIVVEYVTILRRPTKSLPCEKAGYYEKAGHVFYIVRSQTVLKTL